MCAAIGRYSEDIVPVERNRFKHLVLRGSPYGIPYGQFANVESLKRDGPKHGFARPLHTDGASVDKRSLVP